MREEIPLDGQNEKTVSEEDRNLLGALEEKVNHLLAKYQELLREKERLADEVEVERGKRIRLEKKLELLSQDREKVKVRIDHLLHRLRSIDL